MAAAQGAAIFYPNYRGSSGRGLEFATSSQGDLAGKAFDDENHLFLNIFLCKLIALSYSRMFQKPSWYIGVI
jgi:hypothetical protein